MLDNLTVNDKDKIMECPNGEETPKAIEGDTACSWTKLGRHQSEAIEAKENYNNVNFGKYTPQHQKQQYSAGFIEEITADMYAVKIIRSPD